MPRLLLVFWTIVFFQLGTDPSIMAFFITVIIYNQRDIFFSIFKPCFVRDYIDFSNKTIRNKVFLFLFLFLKPLFRLFLSVFRDLCIVRKVCKLKFLIFWLNLFTFRDLYNSVLSLYLGHNNINRIIALLSWVVYLPNIKSRDWGLILVSNLNVFLIIFFQIFSSQLFYFI